VEEFKKPYEEAEAAFKSAGEELNKLSAGATLNADFSIESAEAYLSTLDKLAVGLGKNSTTIGNINGYINTIGDSLSAEDFNKFITNFNAIDISDVSSWEQFPEILEEIGLGFVTTSDATEEAFKNLISTSMACANAIEKINMESFLEDLRSLQSFIGEISSGE
jgi:hypothetical protein